MVVASMQDPDEWSDDEQAAGAFGPANQTSQEQEGGSKKRKYKGEDPYAHGSRGNRFKYLNFRESLKKIQIDVYRSTRQEKTNPTSGDSFLHDALQEYRELCLHKAFLDVYQKIFPLCQSIAQIVYHRKLIFNTIIEHIGAENEMSIEALMALLAGMARDLQDDFWPHVNPLFSATDRLFQTGGSQRASIIEEVFKGLFRVCKTMVKQFTQDMKSFSESAMLLLYNRQPYIRTFAADMMSYVFRNTELESVAFGLQVLMKGEATHISLGTKLEAVALLLAKSLLSTRAHMHSKAENIFRKVFHLCLTANFDLDIITHRNTMPSLALLTLHKLYKNNRKIDLRVPLRVLTEVVLPLVESEDLDSMKPHQVGILAWSFKMVNMMLKKMDSSMALPSIAELLPKMLQSLSKKSSNTLKTLQDFDIDAEAYSVLDDQWAFSLEAKTEVLTPKVLPEIFLMLFGCTTVLRSCNSSESHEATLQSVSTLVRKWTPKMSLPSVKSFCGILTQVAPKEGEESDLVETISPLAFLMIKETLSKEDRDLDILTLALKLHSISGSPDTKVVRDISGMLLESMKTISKSKIEPDSSDPSFSQAKSWYLMLRLLQNFGEAQDGFAAGKAMFSYLGKCGQSDVTLVLQSEALKTALTKAEHYQKMKKAVEEVFLSAGKSVEKINLLENLTKILELPFLEQETKRQLVTSFSSDAWEQLICNLSAAQKSVRMQTMHLLSSGNVFMYKGEIHEDSEDIFHDFASSFEREFTFDASRLVANKIRRYAVDLEYHKLDRKYMSILGHIFVGQLNETFSEFWEPCVNVLKELLSKHFASTFETIWTHLTRCHSTVLEAKSKEEGRENIGKEEEEEGEEECPFDVDVDDDLSSSKRKYQSLAPTRYKLLVSTLKSNKQIWNEKCELIVPFFLEFSDKVCNGSIKISAQDSNDILFEWVGILDSISNIQTLSFGPMLKSKLEQLLSQVSSKLQVQIIKSLRSWKVPILSQRADILIQACDPKTEKDFLPFQRIHNVDKGLSNEERSVLVPLLLRILFPKMKRKKMRLTSRRSQGTARKTILHFLSCFDSPELQLLHELFIHPLISFGGDESDKSIQWTVTQLLKPQSSFSFVESWESTHIPLNVQVGFLDACKDFLSCLGKHMGDYLLPWLDIVICLLKSLCSGHVSDESKQQEPSSVVSSCLSILADIYHNFEDVQLKEFLSYIDAPLQTLVKTGQFQKFQVFNTLIVFLDTILSSQVWSEEVVEKGRLKMILNWMFSSLQEMSEQKKKVLFKLVEKLLEESSQSSITILEEYYPCMLGEVKNLDFNAGRRKDIVFTLNIVQKMSHLFSGNVDAFETLNILVGSLKWFNNKRSVLKNEMLLRAILRVITTLYSSFAGKTGDAVSPIVDFGFGLEPFINLFLYVHQSDVRSELCNILEAILKTTVTPSPEHEQDLQNFSLLCKDLNAISETTIGEIDYDKRLKAYSKLQAIDWERFGATRANAQKILLHQFIHDLTELQDFSMQQASSETIKKFISDCKSHEGDTFDLSFKDDVYRLLKIGINNRKEEIRKEFLHLLSHLFLVFPDYYHSMVILTDEDQEQDFFKNVTHLQLHRRVRAVNKVSKLMLGTKLDSVAVVDIVIPVLMGFICDTTAASSGGTMSNLVDHCIETLGVASTLVEWPLIKSLLNRFLRIMKGKSNHTKSILRSISSTLKFCESESNQISSGDLNLQDMSSEEKPVSGSEPIQYIYRTLLPYLSGLFYQDKDPPSYLVAVLSQVFRIMPDNLSKIEMPQLIQKLSSRLKNMMLSSRDNTRIAICAMLDVSGYKYLSYVVNSIDSSLLSHGVQGYIKPYTLYFLIKHLESKVSEGEIDVHIQTFFGVFELDLFGNIAEDRQDRKNSEKLFKKTFKEGLRCYSLGSFEMVASLMNIEDSLEKMIDFVESNFNTEERRVKVITRLFECLSEGIISNKNTCLQYLLVLFYGIVEDLNERLASQVDALQNFQAISAISTQQSLQMQEADPTASAEYLLLELKAEFALSVLWRFIKNGRLSEGLSKEEYLNLLNPWSAHLISVLKSRRTNLVVLALKCLNRIFMLPLQSNTECASDLSKELFVIMRRSPRLTDSSAQECLKLLTILLKHYTKFSPTNTQCNFLMRLVGPDIEKSENKNGVFSFLKAIIGRGVVLPSVYDLMEKVSSVMISSGSDSTRRVAGQVFLQYLLDYPMNDSRRKHHLEFVIQNCDFSHESGRLSMLELILSVLRKFPSDIIQDLGEMFLFPLVLRVCNEDSPKCKQVAGDALEMLLTRSKDGFLKGSYNLSLKWIQNDKSALKAAGCQLVVFMSKSQCAISNEKSLKTLKVLVRELKESLQEESSRATTKYIHFALEAIGQLPLPEPSSPDSDSDSDSNADADGFEWQTDILDITESLFLVPNALIKGLSARVMEKVLRTTCFSQADHFADDLGRFQRLFRVIVDQMQGDISDELGLNITSVVEALLSAFNISSIKASANEDIDRNLPLSQELALDDTNNDNEEESLPDYFFALKRIISLAAGNTTRGRPATPEQQKTALSVVTVFTNALPKESLEPYLTAFMIPIYHINDSKTAPEDIQEIANSLVETLDGIVGNEAVAMTYNKARQFVLQKRKERKQSKAVLKIMDPSAAAQQKQKRNMKRSRSRKRQKMKHVR
jgi:U3 small nucleolar RNA-associated protein 20